MTGLVLDIIVVVLVLLLLIFGIWRGMYKIIFGLVSSLLALVLTIVLASTVTSFVVEKTTLDERLTTAIDAPISTKVPNANVLLGLYDVNGDGTTELGYSVDGTLHPFSDLLAGTNYSLLSGTLESVIKGKVSDGDSIAFATVLSATVVGYVMLVGVAIVLFIIFTILTKLLMMLLKKIVTATYLGNFVDKLVGAVLGLVIAAVIVWGALAVIRVLGTYEWIIPVNNLIESSTLTKWLFGHNYLYNFLVNSFDIKGIIDTIIAKASALKG